VEFGSSAKKENNYSDNRREAHRQGASDSCPPCCAEFEEHVWGRSVEIAPHLIGLVCAAHASLSLKERAVKRAIELRLTRATADASGHFEAVAR